MGYWPRKQVRVGILAPKTGGRLEVETPVGRTTGAPLSPFLPLINTTLARARSLNALSAGEAATQAIAWLLWQLRNSGRQDL